MVISFSSQKNRLHPKREPRNMMVQINFASNVSSQFMRYDGLEECKKEVRAKNGRG